MNRFWGIIGLVLMMAACQAARVERDPNALSRNLSANPTTLNPVISRDSDSGMIAGYVFDALLTRDNTTLDFKPSLADRWEPLPGGSGYEFHLRDGVKWHDGVPLTADDVVFTYNAIMDPRVDAAVLRGYLSQIKSVTKRDDHTIVCELHNPYFLALEFCSGLPVLPKHLYPDLATFNESPTNRAPIGSGPYRFVKWENGREIVLERNDDYWGVKPAIASLRFVVVSENAAAFQMLKKKQMDMLQLRTVQWSRQTDSEAFNAQFEKKETYPPQVQFVGWNLRRPQFASATLRRALTMLVNRQGVVDHLLYGNGKVITTDCYYYGPCYDHSIEPWSFDPVAASRLLDAEGWIDHDGDGVRDKNGVPFRFSLTYAASSTSSSRIASIMREDMKKAGIDMTAQGLEWTVFLKGIEERHFDAVILGWSGPVERDPYQIWHSSQIEKGSNFVGFSNPQADVIIESIRRELDPEKRQALHYQLHRILHEEQPYTFLFISPSYWAVHKRFENVTAYKLGLDPLEWHVMPGWQVFQ